MPDDHYCCKICGRRDCICPTTIHHAPARHKPTGSAVAVTPKYQPSSFVRDYNEMSVTWTFESNEEADAFANAVSELMKGK